MEEIWCTIHTWLTTIEQNGAILKYIISILGDACLFFITVYTFRLTIFPKKLSFIGIRRSLSAFNGDSFEITLENRSLCPVVIRSVELIYNSNVIKVFDGYCIVEGFKTQTIKMEPYSYILLNDEIMDISCLSPEKMSLWIQTTRGLQCIKHVRFSKITDRIKRKKYMKFAFTMVCRNRYNDKLVAHDVEYVLSFIDRANELRTVFITKTGIMSESLFDYDGLPKELIQNESELRKYFDEEFKKHGLSYKLIRFKEPLKK